MRMQEMVEAAEQICAYVERKTMVGCRFRRDAEALLEFIRDIEIATSGFDLTEDVVAQLRERKP